MIRCLLITCFALLLCSCAVQSNPTTQKQVEINKQLCAANNVGAVLGVAAIATGGGSVRFDPRCLDSNTYKLNKK